MLLGYTSSNLTFCSKHMKVRIRTHNLILIRCNCQFIAYQISSSMPLHHSPPVLTRIKPIILRFRTDSSRVKQYLSTLKNHSSSSLWKPLVPAYCWKIVVFALDFCSFTFVWDKNSKHK